MKILAKIFCTVVCVVFVTQGGNAGERNDLNSSPFPAIMSLDSLGDTVYVDDDWASQADVDLFNIATGNDLVWDTTAFGSIPDAYTGVTERVIFIRPGAYLYQVHAIGLTNLTLIGSGVDSTIIRAPVTTMPDIYFAGGPSRPILFLENCTAHVSNLTIDGDARGANNSRMIGVAFWNSSGDMSNVSILDVRDTPLSSSPQGVGISVNHNDGLPHAVDFSNVHIEGFQKNGTSFTGTDITVNCDSVTVVGLGPTNIVVQNGIQYSNNASGSVTNCVVQGIMWSSSVYIASSLLMYQAETVVVANSVTTNGQAGVYTVDTDCEIDSCDFEASPAPSTVGKSGIRLYSGSFALASVDGTCQVYSEATDDAQRQQRRSLDANESVSLSHTRMTGFGSTGSYGIFTLVDGDTLSITVSDCEITNWNRGVDLTASGAGKIWPANVTGTKLSNTVNAFDNTNNHYWNGNCYSDYTSNFGYPGTYEISGAAIWNVDHSPNPNGCYDVNLYFEDAAVGCAPSDCDTALLYVTLATAELPNFQLELELPAGFVLGLPVTGAIVTPNSNYDLNLIQSFAIASNDSVVLIDAGFQSPGSTGDSTRCIACIPVVNVSGSAGFHAITAENCLWVDIGGVEHSNDQELGITAVNVDCTIPVVTQFTMTPTCAFGSADQTVEKFSATATDASGIESAWISVAPGGGAMEVFNGGNTSPQTFTFPQPEDTTEFYALLTEGVCNSITLYVNDAKCNESAPLSVVNAGRDETPPSVAISTSIPASFCFNDSELSPNYGGTHLDNYINITALLGTNPCAANSGTLAISHAGAADFVASLDRTNFPASDADALDLWTWMLTVPGVSYASGDTFTFDVSAEDCAGNLSATEQFDICVDIQLPENSVTLFDARPAHLGVWLKWSWAAGPDAQEMRIYRSPLSGEYPEYPNDLWNDVANYDVTSVPPVGWTLVTSQSASSGVLTSGSNIGVPNNRGDSHYHVAGADTFWLDAEAGWEDGDGNSASMRDIYRYVTFVRDAGDNWSIGDTVEILENADRSTNYWLGDFSTADSPGDPFSRGRVDTDDLGLLASVYFTNTGGYRNIGPVAVENGFVGRGIPNPDSLGQIEFQDLAPFSFNFHSVSPVGIDATEFAIEPDITQTRSFAHLDESPTLVISSRQENEASSNVVVEVQLRGNESGLAKAAETKFHFDHTVFELVNATKGDAQSDLGTVFTKVCEIQPTNDIGIVAASCGGQTTLSGNATLATITLRKRSESIEAGEFSLHSTQLLDNTGSLYDLEDVQWSVGSAPTLPSSYSLQQNYPNPFNPSTQIAFELPVASEVELTVYNTNGQLIATLLSESREAGTHTVTWDASSLASGVFIYRLKADRFTDTKKMILLR